jgi:hypothetical protein
MLKSSGAWSVSGCKNELAGPTLEETIRNNITQTGDALARFRYWKYFWRLSQSIQAQRAT